MRPIPPSPPDIQTTGLLAFTGQLVTHLRFFADVFHPRGACLKESGIGEGPERTLMTVWGGVGAVSDHVVGMGERWTEAVASGGRNMECGTRRNPVTNPQRLIAERSDGDSEGKRWQRKARLSDPRRSGRPLRDYARPAPRRLFRGRAFIEESQFAGEALIGGKLAGELR